MDLGVSLFLFTPSVDRAPFLHRSFLTERVSLSLLCCGVLVGSYGQAYIANGEVTMEYLMVIAAVAVWFYSDELIKFAQLDRAGRMADRKLDRLEDEQIVLQTNYYAGKEIPSDELVKKAMEGKARMAKLRSSL